jgi:hypothetical protein
MALHDRADQDDRHRVHQHEQHYQGHGSQADADEK